MPSEIEFEQSPAAREARKMLEERLERLAPDELDAFWEAVRRCYASVTDGEGGETQAATESRECSS